MSGGRRRDTCGATLRDERERHSRVQKLQYTADRSTGPKIYTAVSTISIFNRSNSRGAPGRERGRDSSPLSRARLTLEPRADARSRKGRKKRHGAHVAVIRMMHCREERISAQAAGAGSCSSQTCMPLSAYGVVQDA